MAEHNPSDAKILDRPDRGRPGVTAALPVDMVLALSRRPQMPPYPPTPGPIKDSVGNCPVPWYESAHGRR